MFKDTPKGLLEAVLAINKQSREKFVEEQKKMAAKKGSLGTMPAPAQGQADPAAHSGARKMAEELTGKQHKLDVAAPKGKLTAADFKKLRKEENENVEEAAYSAKSARAGRDIGKKGKMFDVISAAAAKRYGSVESGKNVAGNVLKNIRKQHEEVENVSEEKGEYRASLGLRRHEATPVAKMPGSSIPAEKRRSISGRAYGGKAQDYDKKDKPAARPAQPETVPAIVTSLNQAGKDVTRTERGRRLLALQVHSRAKERLAVKEEKDTPGNSTHQCAIHVKSEQYGEGKTLTSQHAEPDAQGNIAWYDVMFSEGIKRVNASDIEIMVSESHGNHKKMKK